MRRVKVGHYIIELDEAFVKKYEDVTCGTVEMFAETYVCLRIGVRNIEDAVRNLTIEEVKQIVIDYMEADIEINE